MQQLTVILMSSGQADDIQLEFFDNDTLIPNEAEYDNYVEIDNQRIPVFVMPGVPVMGRTIALASWVEQLGYGDVEIESN